MAKLLDEQVAAFRNRPLDAGQPRHGRRHIIDRVAEERSRRGEGFRGEALEQLVGRLIGFERRMAAEADRIRREQKVTVMISNPPKSPGPPVGVAVP